MPMRPVQAASGMRAASRRHRRMPAGWLADNGARRLRRGEAPAMRDHATLVASGMRCPPWSRWSEMFRLLSRGTTLRPCLPVAAVVGCVLSAINEGARIASGRTGWLSWVQVGLNFVVPFLVSSYGYLTAARVRGDGRGDGAGRQIPTA